MRVNVAKLLANGYKVEFQGKTSGRRGRTLLDIGDRLDSVEEIVIEATQHDYDTFSQIVGIFREKYPRVGSDSINEALHRANVTIQGMDIVALCNEPD